MNLRQRSNGTRAADGGAGPARADGADLVYERRWWTLLVLSMCVVIIGIDNTVLNVALPSIVRDLGASGSELQWIVDSYTVVFACLLLTAGGFGDRYGRRRALRFGLAWFGVFSALASTASSPTMLILARCLMGFGAAFIYPTTLSIITNTFREPHERARAIGVWAGVSGVGIALGPVLGGLLVEDFGWSAVFLINVPICAIGFLLARWFVPESKSPEESPLDPIGAALSIVGLVGLLVGIIQAPSSGWGSPIVLGGFAVAAIVLPTFWWWERHTDQPMLDVRVFKNPRFSAASATVTLTQFSLYASTFLLTQYFQFLLGYSPLKSGLMLTPVAIGLMVAAPQAPRFVMRWGTTRVVVFGLCMIATSTLCYASDTLMSSFVLGFLVRLFYGLGLGITMAPVTESIMGSLPPSRAGVGSAVNDTTRQTGGALGVAVLGSIFLASYHAKFDAAKQLPASVIHSARDSIGTSLQVAKHLGEPLAGKVQAVAREAFLSSMRISYFVGFLFVVAATVIAFKFLPARAAVFPGQDEGDKVVMESEALAIGVEDAV
jgi:EmrB/QacA subfamily drug resistance transporter